MHRFKSLKLRSALLLILAAALVADAVLIWKWSEPSSPEEVRYLAVASTIPFNVPPSRIKAFEGLKISEEDLDEWEMIHPSYVVYTCGAREFIFAEVPHNSPDVLVPFDEVSHEFLKCILYQHSNTTRVHLDHM